MDPYDLMSIPPEQKQALMSEILRRRQQSAALQEANMRANQFNPVAAAAQMANNPALARSADMAARNAQAQYKPLSMGQMGYSITSSGEFVPSPMYEDEKKAQREAKKELQEEKLQAQRERDRDRVEAQKERDAAMFENRRSLAMTLAAMRGSSSAAGKAEKAAKGKTLPAGEIRKLTEKEAVASGFSDLADSFRDELSGSPGLASTQNILGKYQPLGVGKKYADQSNWWQNYNDQKNRIRNQLFGSALTKTEQDAFDRANINEGMEPAEIKRRLGQQRAAVAGAYNKLRGNFSRGGYNTDEFEDIAVPEGIAKPGAAPAAAAPSWLPPGAKILGVREK